MVVPISEGDAVEAGMIGRDGVVGSFAALDGSHAINRAVVQVAGDALTIGASIAREAVKSSDSFRMAIYRYDLLLLAQAQQAAVCNAKHTIEERLCRWLLRTRDLVSGDDLPLTQDFLAHMLGVGRPSVTLAASQLQSGGIISYTRGRIRLLDRERMEDCACECYEAIKRQERLLLGRAPN